MHNNTRGGGCWSSATDRPSSVVSYRSFSVFVPPRERLHRAPPRMLRCNQPSPRSTPTTSLGDRDKKGGGLRQRPHRQLQLATGLYCTRTARQWNPRRIELPPNHDAPNTESGDRKTRTGKALTRPRVARVIRPPCPSTTCAVERRGCTRCPSASCEQRPRPPAPPTAWRRPELASRGDHRRRRRHPPAGTPARPDDEGGRSHPTSVEGRKTSEQVAACNIPNVVGEGVSRPVGVLSRQGPRGTLGQERFPSFKSRK